MTRSTSPSSSRFSACAPSSASRVAYPSRRRARAMVARMFLSSSAIRTVGIAGSWYVASFPTGGWLGGRGSLHGKADGNSRPAPGRSARPDHPSVLAHDAVGDRHAEARPSPLRARGEVRLEDPAKGLLLETHSAVAHLDLDGFAFHPGRRFHPPQGDGQTAVGDRLEAVPSVRHNAT